MEKEYKEILQQTDQYYTQKAKEFGATSKGADWNSKAPQILSFDILTGLFSHEKNKRFTLCDFGCGYGYFSAYLREKGYHCSYTGIDVSETMIDLANETYGEQQDTVFLHSSGLTQMYDYIVASGPFNVRQQTDPDTWTQYMIATLNEFHRCSGKGFAFNCLTKYSDAEYRKEYLYYADPLFYFDYAKRHFSRNVALLHDYDLYQFTIYVRK